MGSSLPPPARAGEGIRWGSGPRRGPATGARLARGPMPFRSGLLALVGRPNAGKSSLLNTLVGERIAAVSRRPQTTRNRVVGMWNTDQMQVVLLDTPGLHDAWTLLNKKMVATAEKVLQEVDAVAWIIDANEPIAELAAGRPALDTGLCAVRDRLAASGLPLVVVLNKVDAVEKGALLPVMAALADVGGPVVPVSARRREGLDALAAVVARLLPVAPPQYPVDQLTDATERFIVAELIRERVMEHTHEEVPYAVAVEIERFDESEREAGRVQVHAKILVEKESQKGIVVGRGGRMIKTIGTEAREAIEHLLGCRVRLDLFVVVERDWTTNPRILRELGLD